MDDLPARIEVLERAAREGGAIALEAFRSEFDVETKETPLDTVTEVDRTVQRRITDLIEERYPGEPLVGEEGEGPKRVPDGGEAWLVDPIDGTNNYVAGNRTWGTCVAVVRDGLPVAGVNHFPALGDTYRTTTVGAARNGEAAAVSDRTDAATFTVGTIFSLTRGDHETLSSVIRHTVDELGDFRRIGSSQATLSMVAAGELDAAVSPAALPPWDTVAGVRLIRQAGGTVTDLDGEPWRPGSEGLVASNDEAHDRLVEAFDGT